MNMRKVDVSREDIVRFEQLVNADDEDGGYAVRHLPEELQEYIEKCTVVLRSMEI